MADETSDDPVLGGLPPEEVPPQGDRLPGASPSGSIPSDPVNPVPGPHGTPRGGAPRREAAGRGESGSRGAAGRVPRPGRDKARARDLPLGPRLFTVAEANALIPFLERALAELSALRGELRILRRDIEVLSLIASSASGAGNPDTAELRERRKSFRAVAAEIEKINRALEMSGCLVKHPDEGLVDFFHLRGDRLVFLCWRAGEERIRAWHPLSGGFPTRQPLDHGTEQTE